MDHYTKKALWIYWIRGDDEVELTDEESSDSDREDEVTEIFRIETNVFNFETPLSKPFNYKNGCLEWPTCSWRDDGYCNGRNLPGAYIVGNILRYQNLEWYDALKDSELKEEALKNKAIMKGMIDDNDESSNEGWRRWDNYEITNHDNEYENEHG
ncbi:hypothetical protein Tco_0204231 [Tanacetum coccineum]